MKEKVTTLDKLNNIISIAGRTVLMSLLFLVSCLPVVTIGQAWCALLTGIRWQIRGDSWFEGYKFGFKNRFWRGIAAWCVLLIPNVYFLLEVSGLYTVMQELNGGYGPYVARLGFAGLMFAMTTMVTTALLLLNVYIPTKISLWISNATSMVFKAPLLLLAAALLFWLPVLLTILEPAIMFFIFPLFLVAYYPLQGWVATLALKGTIIDYLIDARADGTLLAEEGRRPEPKDEEDEE